MACGGQAQTAKAVQQGLLPTEPTRQPQQACFNGHVSGFQSFTLSSNATMENSVHTASRSRATRIIPNSRVPVTGYVHL